MTLLLIYVNRRTLSCRWSGIKSSSKTIALPRIRLFFGGGLEPETIYANKSIWPYSVEKDGDLRRIECKSGDSITIEDVMREALKKIKLKLSDAKVEISRAVLIVPSFFNTATRKALSSAFKFHNIQLIDVLNAIPTLIENCSEIKKESFNKYILSFTVDTGEVTVYSSNDQDSKIMTVCEASEIDYSRYLLFNEIVNEYITSINMGMDIRNKSFIDALQNIDLTVNNFKLELKLCEIHIKNSNGDFKYTFTEKKLDALYKNYMKRVVNILNDSIKRININNEDITDIVFVTPTFSSKFCDRLLSAFQNFMPERNLYKICRSKTMQKLWNDLSIIQISESTNSFNAPSPNLITTWNDTTSMKMIERINLRNEVKELKFQQSIGMQNESKQLNIIRQLNEELDELNIKVSSMKQNESTLVNTINQLNTDVIELKSKRSETKPNELDRLNIDSQLDAGLDESKIEIPDMISIETNEHLSVLQNSYKKFDERKIAGIDFTQNRCRAVLVNQSHSIWESASELKLNQEDLIQTFKELKDNMKIDTGVVVVNGKVTNAERRDLVLTAAMTQVLVLRLVNDTTAIFAANESFNDAKNRHVLILDVNYQRFQTTALKIENKRTKLQLKETTDQFTEGKFDEALYKYCSEQFRNFTGMDLIAIDSPGTQRAFQQLKEAALQAKKRLLVINPTRIDVGALYQDQDFSIKFSTNTCQHIVSKFMEDIPAYIFKCFREKSLQRQEITDVILIGDFVQFLDIMIGELFPRAIVHKAEDSNETVVQGAAILAKVAFQNPDLKFDKFIEPKQAIIF